MHAFSCFREDWPCLRYNPRPSYQLGHTSILAFPHSYASVTGMPPLRLPNRHEEAMIVSSVQQRDGASFPEATTETVSPKKHGREDTKHTVGAENAGVAKANESQKETANRATTLGDLLSPARTKEDEMAAFLLSSLAVNDRPVLTEEQFDFEKETLTDEERSAALVDLFGKLHVDDSIPQAKRSKRDLD